MTNNVQGLSYLAAIRPDPGWETDRCLVTSYSSDMVVLVATMLALAGLDDDRGSGSKVDFASAHEKLSGRLRFLVQAGRISAPKVKQAILGIMDRFVCEIKNDERVRSWHPKLTLVRYVNPNQELVQWRIWIASRNLTRDNSYDLGLLLVANPNEEGTQVSGIGEIGKLLSEIAGLTQQTQASIKRELDRASWVAPVGINVRQIQFRHNGVLAGLPKIPEGLEELLVVSPFLDGKVIRSLGKWGSTATKRLLLSSRSSLSALLHQRQQPMKGFEQLLYMDAPDIDAESLEAEKGEEEAEQIFRGLHAKLICAKLQQGARVWLGSANATARGWQGTNTEVIAELDVSDDLYDELREFVSNGRTLSEDELDGVEPDPHEGLLEEARKRIVSEWNTRLVFNNGVPLLTSEAALNPGIPNVNMKVGLLTSNTVDCPRDVKSLNLPQVSTYQFTELVLVQLSIDELDTEWVQKVDLVEGIPKDRDQRALARHLSPRVFLEWIRSLLHSDNVGDGGGRWDEDLKPINRVGENSALATPWWAPSLEEVLRAWSRNPDSIRSVDQKLKAYVKFFREQDNENSDTNDDSLVLQEFTTTWTIIRAVLMEQRGYD